MTTVSQGLGLTSHLKYGRGYMLLVIIILQGYMLMVIIILHGYMLLVIILLQG